jgi:mRNA interferase RelE/StbE
VNVSFLSKFQKDISKIDSSELKRKLTEVIKDVENAAELTEIKDLKKLRGHSTAFRIRIGDYRIGIFFENEIVEFARFVHRKDIYKVFP